MRQKHIGKTSLQTEYDIFANLLKPSCRSNLFQTASGYLDSSSLSNNTKDVHRTPFAAPELFDHTSFTAGELVRRKTFQMAKCLRGPKLRGSDIATYKLWLSGTGRSASTFDSRKKSQTRNWRVADSRPRLLQGCSRVNT